ncbi:efflux pump protein [Westerdykella ornata]|uniref:Efflux pump protein n=1 Tax=Westerdykella ornata TaxID=318751 RepID=A0A6A6JMH8_WESOR|nr:efflux pump protein [Westerdykella ornata]KAF2276866.1 efflux pump protein [Westerdykella ornata]
MKENTEYITGSKLAAVIGSVTLIAYLLLLDQAILGTAIPQITTQFRSLPDVGWYTGAYPLANAALQPLSGKLYTHFRAKYTFLVFLFIFELGSLICGVAPTSAALIIGRGVAGLGASGLMNGGMTIIAGATPLAKRPLYTGIMMGVGSLGIVTGPLVGGALTEYATWRWCFFINLPVGGIAFLLLLLINIPDLTVKERLSLNLLRKILPDLDLPGFALIAPAAVMLLLALQFGSEHSHAWNSAVIIGLLCGAGVTAIVFGFWEWHMGERAMIPGSMIKHRVMWTSALVNITSMGTVVVGSNYLPIYFQAVKGSGPTMSGVSVFPAILPQLVFAVLAGAGVSKLGYYLPWSLFSGVLTAIGNGLVSTFSPTTSTATWIGYQILLGAGRGAGMQIPTIAIQTALPPAQIPVSLAILMFTYNLCTSVFLVIATTIFTQTIVSELKKNAPSVSTQAALAAGGSAGAVRSLVPPGSPELNAVLRAYSSGVRNVFLMLAGLSVVSFAASWGMGWNDVRAKKNEEQEKGDVREGDTV